MTNSVSLFISLNHKPVLEIVCRPEFPLKKVLSYDLNFIFIWLNIGLKKKTYKKEIIKQFKMEGNKKNQIEIPDERITFSSLFLLSFMKECIDLKRKTVGNIIGNNDAKCKIAIFITILIGTSFEELLLSGSIKSIVRNKEQQKKVIINKEKRFCFII